MIHKRKCSVGTKITAAVLTVALLFTSGIPAYAGKTLAESTHYQEQVKLEDVLYNNHYYTDYLKEQGNKFKDVKKASVQIDLPNYFEFKGEEPQIKKIEGRENVLYVNDDNKSVSWKINVEKAGYYQMNMDYFAIDGNTLPITRGIKIDGKYLYDELVNIKLLRHWVDSEKPKVNNLGDQVRPSQLEVREWINTDIYDAQGEYPEALKVGLSEGEHTITLVYVDQPIAISSFTFKAPRKIPSYKEVEAFYKSNSYKSANKGFKVEAEDKENIDFKTDSGIIITNAADLSLTATSDINCATHKVYNHIGSSTWGKGGQEIQWTVDAPESGLYKIVLKFCQDFGNGLSSTRRIRVDGEVPFKEFNEYEFDFKQKWRTDALSDKDGNPYYVYLEKGKHTIGMSVVMGPLTETIHLITDITSRYSNLIRNITMVTGQTPDINYDYRLEDQIPSLLGDMKSVSNSLKSCVKQIDNYSNKTTTIGNTFIMAYELMDKMIAKPDKIPAGLADLIASLTSIGDNLKVLKDQPLSLDTLEISPVDKEVVNKNATIWQRIYTVFANYIISYTKDYNAIGFMGEANEEYESVKIWVSRGKEWCEILKDLVDNDFTKKHHINVELNILPGGALGGGQNPLILAINAGTEPDGVIGFTGATVDYAIRDAVYDLSKFDDFEEIKSRYYPMMFKGLRYSRTPDGKKGYYGIPEEIGFNAMFYRTDIFDQLDFKIPNTWDELTNDLLPQLYQYNMQFSNGLDYNTRIFQNGGLLYSKTGYSTVIDSPKSLKGIKDHVEMYTQYGCPVASNFLNRFRQGEMPIGIGGFDFYLQLSYAVPELAGKWKMVPVPGTMGEDGKINRLTGFGPSTKAIILSTAEKRGKEKLAWEFIKWYTSTDVQTTYGQQIESIIGTASRWDPANTEAFKRLPWSKTDIKVIENSWENMYADQTVLGDYITARSLGNAVNRCITQGESVREAVEKATEEINDEFRRKQRMYKVNPEGLD